MKGRHIFLRLMQISYIYITGTNVRSTEGQELSEEEERKAVLKNTGKTMYTIKNNQPYQHLMQKVIQ